MLRPRARRVAWRPWLAALVAAPLAAGACGGPRPDAGPHAPASPGDVAWLRERSMLLGAGEVAATLDEATERYRRPYGLARPDDLLDLASVWFNAYPASLITPVGESVLETFGDPAFLDALGAVGVQAMHTGPMKRSGGVAGREYLPTVDGYFDRIELAVDPTFGTDDQYRRMVEAAAARGIAVIADIVPGHTGKGPDFRLAELGEPGFAGLYTMAEIRREDWGLLPAVGAGEDSVNLSRETARALADKGYIAGPLETVIFARPGIKESNWSATGVIAGVDGRERRWVYLHLFKAGQPSLDWLDPGFAAERLVAGDIQHSLGTLGARALRLDANMFLGLEPRRGGEPGWLLEHPLSTVSTATLAMLVRRLGGFSFQELNASLDRIGATLESGPELAYDFTTRPAYLYALATGDAGPLRLMLRRMLDRGVRPARMAHALQNHDELMLEASDLRVAGDTVVEYEGARATGAELFARLGERTTELTTGERGPYNEPFAMSPGVCSTLAGLAAASLGVTDLDAIDPGAIGAIRSRHLAAAAYNALQPGAFVVSGWDLVGALPVPRESVRERLADNDCRWLNRGAYDLAGVAPDADRSAWGLPRARSLYGSVPDQLGDPASFASRLRDVLAARGRFGVDRGRLVAVPTVGSPGLAVLVVELPRADERAPVRHAVSAVNFGADAVRQTIADRRLRPGAAEIVFSTLDGPMSRPAGAAGGRLVLELAPAEAQLVVVGAQARFEGIIPAPN